MILQMVGAFIAGMGVAWMLVPVIQFVRGVHEVPDATYNDYKRD